MIHHLPAAVSGAVFFGYIIIALFFYRFWRRTGARLFGAFALAFLILAIERVMLLAALAEPINVPWIYSTRLLAFLVIAWAIWDMNRRRS